VVGASARAAVHSLARAGVSAWSVDLFADRDLTRVAECVTCPIDRYPEALPELAAEFPPGPVLYTGGLENYPHVVRELAAGRELWGNPPEVLEQVRDPFTLFPALARAGFATPRLVPAGEPCPVEGRWLRKPIRSGGGLGIRFARPGEATSPHHYFQEFIDGAPLSALFVNDALVGVTEQLIGEPWLHAKPFAYCGNVGPFEAAPIVRELGNMLCENTGIRCVWGADFILRDGAPCVLEVNPRYTAAAEVLEHATGRGVFIAGPPPGPLPEGGRGVGRRCVGKAIYYAPHAIRFPQGGTWDADVAGEFDPWRLPGFADIPEPGSTIEPGSPVLTCFAAGSTPAEVRERLQSRAAELDTLFRDAQP
jgi:predicted ATP-grasp superfamily ATP-dependent carboligase